MNVRLINIERIGLSSRSMNALLKNGVRNVGDLIALTEDDLYGIRSLGVKSVNEILAKIEEYSGYVAEGSLPAKKALEVIRGQESAPDEEDTKEPQLTKENYKAWTATDEGRDFIRGWLQKKDIPVGVLRKERLPYSLCGVLALYHYTDLAQVIFMTKEEILALKGLDEKCADRIVDACARYLKRHMDAVISAYEASRTEAQERALLPKLRFLPEYREDILSFVRSHDEDIVRMHLSRRTENCLTGAGYRKLSDIVLMTETEFLRIHAMGRKSTDEIMAHIEGYLMENAEHIRGIPGIAEDAAPLLPVTEDRVLAALEEAGYDGLEYEDLCENLSVEDGTRRKEVQSLVGKLIGAGKAAYVEGRCYRVWPKFLDCVRNGDVLDARAKSILLARADGAALEAIGKQNGVTRERIRQIMAGAIAKLKHRLLSETGSDLFDEDYYAYLWSTYAVDREEGCTWLGMTPETFLYLDMAGIRPGEADLSLAVDDREHLDVSLRLKIRNCLNRDRIFADGRWIDRERPALERYVLRKYCSETVSFTLFVRRYNRFLRDQEVPEDADVWMTGAVLSSVRDRISASRTVLWKPGEQLRFYDIDGRDYGALLYTLGLDTYEDVAYSTEKFVRDYPELMKQYDIRDAYELHNLLAKILPEGSLHDFHCGIAPDIRFGHPDRTEMARRVLALCAPVTQEALAEKIGELYGFDPAEVISEDLAPLGALYRDGHYVLQEKELSADQQAVLKDLLTDDLYMPDEIRHIWKKAAAVGELPGISGRNLKKLGFELREGYIIRADTTAKKYFEKLLTAEDTVDIAPLRKRFGGLRVFTDTVSALCRNLTIVRYSGDLYLSIRRLGQEGITRPEIRTFCRDAGAFAGEGTLFCIRSLKAKGFASGLFRPGLPDALFESFILEDAEFSSGEVFGVRIFCRGKRVITAGTLPADLIRESGTLPAGELLRKLQEIYGCRVEMEELMTVLAGTQVFYDRPEDRFYRDEALYEQSLARR